MSIVSITCPDGKLEPDLKQKILDTFHDEGVAMIPGVLRPDEVVALRELTDRFIDHPDPNSAGYAAPVANAMVLRCTQALHRLFCKLLVREPMLSLAEAVLGPNVGFCGQNVIRSETGTGISSWHVDDMVEFPLPDSIARHDARIRLPVFWLSFQIALSDIDSPENGPTEIVPRSHFSGRPAPNTDTPEFEGRGPVPILCRAGDVYIFNHQLWHRGSINQSPRRRYLMQNQYCRAWGLYRFNSSDASRRLSEADAGDLPERLTQLLNPTRQSAFG